MTDLLIDERRSAVDATVPHPMIIAEDAHVTYRVHASGKRMTAGESLFTTTALAAAAPNCTAVAPVKLVPVMVTTVLPAAGPVVGDKLVTVGTSA